METQKPDSEYRKNPQLLNLVNRPNLSEYQWDLHSVPASLLQIHCCLQNWNTRIGSSRVFMWPRAREERSSQNGTELKNKFPAADFIQKSAPSRSVSISIPLSSFQDLCKLYTALHEEGSSLANRKAFCLGHSASLSELAFPWNLFQSAAWDMGHDNWVRFTRRVDGVLYVQPVS